MGRLRGSVEQRRAQKAAQRAANQIRHARTLAETSTHSGHQMVTAACQIAKATSRRLPETTQRLLARAIAQAVEQITTVENRTQ